MINHIKGLTDQEVETSRNQYGSNQLAQIETEGFWSKLIGNFDDPMIKILIVALVINVVFVFLGEAEWYESLGIAGAVLIATLVSTLSEYKNEQTFQKLQEDASKILCKVYRNGIIQEVMIDDIVKGDMVLLQTGDKIPADGVLIHGKMNVDQSTLNGESKEVKKEACPSEYKRNKEAIDFLNPCEVFRGTVVCFGEGILEVDDVGVHTQYGKLAQDLADPQRDSPLKVKLADLAQGISKFGYIGASLIAAAFIIQKMVFANHFNGAEIMAYLSNLPGVFNDVIQAVILAIIVIVVAVPEGLPMMIAMVLSINMKKMLKDNVLVRKLIGIETSGSINILFSDKTGTITKGKLEAVSFVSGACKAYETIEAIEEDLKKWVQLSIIENTSAVFSIEDHCTKCVGGNGTERALMQFVGRKALEEIEGVERVATLPFRSDKKYSAAQIKGQKDVTLIKGAPEKILKACNYFYDEKGESQPLQDLTCLNKQLDDYANRAMRVLALATSDEPIQDEIILENLTLVGVVAIRDDIRPESIEAIKEMYDAGVQVVMVTGDKKETALAIAKEVGLLSSKEDIVLESSDLQTLSDDQLKDQLRHLKVIARALPSDKTRLVRIAQSMEYVVGMTGDGVNDAPALKKADVGFAMGSGTEVAKEVGDIVVLDDNFNSIAKAVLYGRTIYQNIKKFIVYQLTVNMAAISIAFLGPFIGVDLPLSMTQMLWVNLIMDTLAALAFGGEPALRRYMNAKPTKRSEKIISKDMWHAVLFNGAFIATLSLIFLLSESIKNIFRTGNNDIYRLTGFFTFFILLNAFNAFNARTPLFNLFDNMSLRSGFLKVMAVIFTMQVVIVWVGGEVLRTKPLTLEEWAFVLGLSLLIIPFDLLRKVFWKATGTSNRTQKSHYQIEHTNS